jgi:hypothetical protein
VAVSASAWALRKILGLLTSRYTRHYDVVSAQPRRPSGCLVRTGSYHLASLILVSRRTLSSSSQSAASRLECEVTRASPAKRSMLAAAIIPLREVSLSGKLILIGAC